MKKSVLTFSLFLFFGVLLAQNHSEEYFNRLQLSNALPLILNGNMDFDFGQTEEIVFPQTELSNDSFEWEENRILLRSNARFEVWGLISEQAAADTVISILTNNYDRIADSLNTIFSHKIIVDIYPDLATYHAAIGWPTAPDWVVGNATGDNKIDMVSPYNPGPVHSFSSMMNVTVHEMVHNFVAYLTPGFNVPIWINEGAATFLSYQTPTVNSICNANSLNNGNIPSFTDLANGQLFGNIGGYQYAYTIAEMIVEEHGGASALSSLISTGMNYNLVGYTSEPAFYSGWNHFLYVNYPCANYSGLQASFAADITTGDGPLTVHFTDFSAQFGTPISSWSWDFDNDGTVDSYDENPIYTYNTMGTYSVKLTVTSGSTSSTYTRNNYIDVLTTGGVGEIEHTENNILIYPNPARDQINVIIDGHFTVALRNLMGQEMVITSGRDRVLLDVSNLPTGMYWVAIKSNHGTAIKRVLIQ